MQKNAPTTIDEYLKPFPQDVREKLQQMREFIKKLVPEATEAISYQMPTFKLNGKNLLHFAGYKNHIGFYPFPSGVAAFEKETQAFVTSKGTIQFALNQPIPWDLVEKIVRFRTQEYLAQTKKK